MPNSPVILIGRNVTFTLAPVTIDGTTGARTVGTAVALTGKAKRAAKRHRRRTFEALPLDATLVNNVPWIDDWVVELSAIRRGGASGAGPNPLDDTFAAGPYAQIVITSPTNVDTYQGCLINFDWEVVQGAENIESIVLIPIDIGAANPART